MSSVAQHLSETVEHYTPPEIVHAAREVMGGIDLDPASSHAVNAWSIARFKYHFRKFGNVRT